MSNDSVASMRKPSLITTRRSHSTSVTLRRHNGRAWICATCSDPKYRDGKKAVESATRACELTSWKNASFIDTLAAACAEAGDFASAVKWQEKALGLPVRGEPRRNAFDSRMALYETKKPYRDESDADRTKENAVPATRP